MNEIVVSNDGLPRTARVSGPMDVYHAGALKARLLALAEDASPLALDLSEVSEFDSAGFQLLALLQRELKVRGGSLAIGAASRPVDELLETYRCGRDLAAKVR